MILLVLFFIFFFQAEDGIRDGHVTGVQTCALPLLISSAFMLIPFHPYHHLFTDTIFRSIRLSFPLTDPSKIVLPILIFKPPNSEGSTILSILIPALPIRIENIADNTCCSESDSLRTEYTVASAIPFASFTIWLK